MQAALPLIDTIRSASRLMVRELGFMNPTLAGSRYSPSVVHALMEVGKQEQLSAAQLVQILGLEKSSVSRLLAKLVSVGELEERAAPEDARVKYLRLTPQGEETVRQINAYGHARVASALEKLSAPQQRTVSDGLTLYARALQQHREGSASRAPSALTIVSGYQPGMIGRITEMHGRYYAREHQFGAFFEAKVAAGLAEFSARLNSDKNQLWQAMRDDQIVGSVAIDGEDLQNGEAHLRWFILDENCRGSGAGRQLMQHALAFCDAQGFPAVQLWTFNKLTAARKLYDAVGFTLTREWQGDQWGSEITEQQFTRCRPG